jgi:putative endonuclease
MDKMFNKVSGDHAEKIAIKYLINKSYKIIEKNYKNKIGEIDIIAKDKDILVFVEVKFRSNDYFGLPREAVNTNKQFKIRNVATQYITSNKLFDKTCRFDVLEILGNEITHLMDCF